MRRRPRQEVRRQGLLQCLLLPLLSLLLVAPSASALDFSWVTNQLRNGLYQRLHTTAALPFMAAALHNETRRLDKDRMLSVCLCVQARVTWAAARLVSGGQTPKRQQQRRRQQSGEQGECGSVSSSKHTAADQSVGQLPACPAFLPHFPIPGHAVSCAAAACGVICTSPGTCFILNQK